MKKPPLDWYRHIWSLDLEDMSWTESTDQQVDFAEKLLQLRGEETILDLACGWGRHALALSRRGYRVTGVDITPQYIERASADARRDGLKATFVCADIRDVRYEEEFDVVLSMADGAIGYLEDDRENEIIFDRIAAALKPGGKHLMDVCNAEFAEGHFPMRTWEIGKKSVSLPQFDWDPKERRMLYGGWGVTFGTIAQPPKSIDAGSSTRLYSLAELDGILRARKMTIMETRANFTEEKASRRHLQMEIYSKKAALRNGSRP
jgi:SAM-dependent methyltransferase